jgi:hypothetical protein
MTNRFGYDIHQKLWSNFNLQMFCLRGMRGTYDE